MGHVVLIACLSGGLVQNVIALQITNIAQTYHNQLHLFLFSFRKFLILVWQKFLMIIDLGHVIELGVVVILKPNVAYEHYIYICIKYSIIYIKSTFR